MPEYNNPCHQQEHASHTAHDSHFNSTAPTDFIEKQTPFCVRAVQDLLVLR